MSSSELFAIEPDPAGGEPSPHRGESRSLYRKYRPQSFAEDELVGQEHIVQTLRNAITLGRVAHAYLFCGPRGTGKTTTARLLAKAVNCLDPDPNQRPCNQCAACIAINSGATTDVIEIDAASNRGIDDIRDLRERVKYAPTQLATKFYIIDEAHQITGAAANAFLKTLEEPPAHTRFVLATTDPEELLQTIVSRCQRFDFRRISLDAMVGRLRTVVEAEGLQAEQPALEAIARYSTGSLRDALGLLDQLSVYQEERGEAGERLITADAVRALLGISRNERITGLVNAIADRDPAIALGLVNDAIDAGEDARQLNRQLVGFLRELMFTRAGADRTGDETTRAIAGRFSVYELGELARLFSEVDFKIKRSLYGQLPLEIALIEAIERGSGGLRIAPSPSVPVETTLIPAPVAPAPPPTTEVPPTRRLSERVRQPAPAPPSADRSSRKLDSPLSVAPAPGIVRNPEPTAAATTQAPASSSEPLRSLGSASGEPAGALTVENLAEQWNQIRLDVKSVDRRIEALLASSDPYDVVQNEVHIVSPYEFHARKLSEDAPRNLMADVIGRIFGQRVIVYAHQIDQAPPRRGGSEPSQAPPPPPRSEPPTAVETAPREAVETTPAPPESILEERKKTAMSIFDAVPVDDPDR